MNYSRFCNQYLDENYRHYVIEYRGNFESQINKLDYACGKVVTDTLGVIAVKDNDFERLKNDVPAIIFVESRIIYVLQDIDPSTSDNINTVKINPYLNLNGKGILVGMIDSGINYLNEEFINEDGTSRIAAIWDQTIQNNESDRPTLGSLYTNSKINEAIKTYKNGGDPYVIVPSKDEIDHGTKMAGIIGAKGYNGKMQGIANGCEFLVVKLLQAANVKKSLRENNIPEVPVYNNAEVLSAIEFLRVEAKKLGKPLIVYFGVGSPAGSHDGYNITSRFISSLATKEGIIFVAGTGNLGDADGHRTNFIKKVGDIDEFELKISNDMKRLEFTIWIQKPDKMSLNIIDPTGEEIGFINSKLDTLIKKNFYLIDTQLTITSYDPESVTGHQTYILVFNNIKAGIWKFRLKGEYISTGRYDVWLPDKSLLPNGTKFLQPSSTTTLTIPSTAKKVTTVAYYDEGNNSLVSSSGQGYNSNYLINPDIAAGGINVLTTSGKDNKIVTVSGSSVATAIVTGASCLLLQWEIAKEQYTGIYSTKVRSSLIYSAEREKNYIYPNEILGYGKLDLLEVFKILGGNYRGDAEEKVKEYYINNLFVRYPMNIKYKEVML